ncbi:Uncharacterised protein [Pseudomonas putida]|nr:hypothetical protein [Pseudomonas sp. KHPS1]CAB5601479.1 Uncharacterised protein [Pseudomonas putida]UTH37260.1 hypothetical protein NLY39_03605 [Pseudomonas sp. KHPS1]CAB5676348.1 Uncharacterised protein [Pseudomonas putida]CAB5698986.1 Uncharacterised protein [Pseudomonas putida]CAC9681433.1 Uncharacterised protein [Pseudomonas putida]
MNKKDSFNDVARKVSETFKEKEQELRKARDQQLIEKKKEQNLRMADDMEKAKQRILREHNRLDCRPSYARRKPLTTKQLEEQVKRAVEADNLKESNIIHEQYRREVMLLENAGQHQQGEKDIDKARSPDRITGVFNDLPKVRDGNELER